MISFKSNKFKISQLFLGFISSAFIGVAVSYGDFYLFHFILIILTIMWIYNLKENKYQLSLINYKKKYVPTLLFIFAWYLLSLFWTPNLQMGLKYNFYIFCGLALTLAIVSFSSNMEKFDKVFRILCVFFFAEIFIAFLESLTNFRMPISSYSSIALLFGKEPINFSDLGTPILYSNFKPPTGFRWNTNDLAICMVLGLPFFMGSKKTSLKFFGILAITLIIAMTASRAVFLALLLSFSVYLFFIKKQIGTLIFIWVASIALLLSMISLKDSDNPRINELANSLEALSLYFSGEIDVGGSIEWRRDLVENGLTAFSKTYGLGLGAGGTVANQELIGPVAGRFTSMHNFWIELLVEGGLLVGIVFSIWVFSMLINLYKISRISTDNNLKYYSQSLFLSFIAFIPAAVAASSTIYFFPMWIMFGMSITVINLSKTQLV